MEPVKVIAPIAAPNDISIKLAILIFPSEPKLNTSGFKKADIATKLQPNLLNYEILQLIFPRLKAVGFKKAPIATKTAAKPTKL